MKRNNKPSKIVDSLTEGDYHALDRLSKHILDDFDKNPYAFFRRRAAGLPTSDASDATKAAYVIGSAVHCAVLEPKLFEGAYIKTPDTIKVRRGKAWEEFEEECNASGKTPLKGDEYDIVRGITENITKNANAEKLLSATKAHREVSALWTHPAHPDVELKSRLDFASDNYSVLGDLKTTQDATPEAFAKASDAFGYDIQAAFYLDAVRACGYSPKVFAFICVEKTYPFTPAVYTFDPDSDFILAGRKEYERRLNAYESWLSLDLDTVDAGYTAHNLRLPAWSKRFKALFATEEDLKNI